MSDHGFDELIREQVRLRPDATALDDGERRMSYREMSERADALGAALRERGVRHDEPVGIAMVPSCLLVVSMLAVYRAGCPWLPLDPAYPAGRLCYMCDDAGAGLVIADPGGADGLGIDPARVVTPADLPDPDVPPSPLPDVTSPRDAAYVIYTSGSTGRPKGVLVTRWGLANLVAAEVAVIRARPGDRVLQFAPTSFDASVFEIVMALTAGATLVMASRADLAPGPGLVRLLDERSITHVTLPPSVLGTLPPTALPDLAVLVCAGEALPPRLVELWAPGRRMINAYGPTECTVWSTFAEVRAGDARPSIGSAIPGATVEVLDEVTGQPALPGSPGELAVGGAGLARGYLGRPGLTADRFVPHPVTGARLYRTGDRVVERFDGGLDFLDRVDHQAKIRGIRVEPGEVAGVLEEQPGVTAAVVVVHGSDGAERLVGYVTGPVPDGPELLAVLGRELPAHLVPAAVVVLDAMPLTPSGKIDRAALPDPGAGRASGAAPRTSTERVLADLVAELLGVPAVGVDEDFFTLGGHSLLAARLAARVRSVLGRELPLDVLNAERTVAAVAAALDERPTAGLPAVRTREHTVGDRSPLSFPQERIWFLERLSPGNRAYNAQATLRLHGPLDRAALQAALEAVVARHDIFRTAFVEVDGVPVQELRPPVPVRVPLVDLTGLDGPDRERRLAEVVADAMREPFDLGAPPLVRWLLVRLRPDEHVVVHVEHHLVHDGWSYALFLRELKDRYTEALGGGVPDAAPLPLQFADFARWQREWMDGEVLDRYLEHWVAELDGAPPALDLPTDRPRPATQSFAGHAVRIDLPPELCAGLRRYSRERAVTLYAVMLGGFAALMSRYAGQDEVVVGSGVASRRTTEIEQLIGMIVNTLPLRIGVPDDIGFDGLVARVHETVGRAHQWQDIPFDRLVAALPATHDPSRNPVFGVMFSFHDSYIPDIGFGGLTGSVTEQHNGTAKADLNVVVIPRSEQRSGRGSGDGTDPITLIWEYATDLFDESTMREMVARYTAMLTAAMDRPDAPVSGIPLVAPHEIGYFVGRARGADTPCAHDRSVPEAFADRVAATPRAPALVAEDGTMTYAELDARSARWARALRRTGSTEGTAIGVFGERTAELLVAMLGVLRAGAAYVPLEPSLPAGRLAGMIADAGVTAVAATVAPGDRLPSAIPVVTLDEAAREQAGADRGTATAGPDDVAYVMFTSGSTGRPKGVAVRHRSVLSLVCGNDYARLGPGVRVAQMASASFDALTFELWGALLNGGTVCVVPPDVTKDPAALGEYLRRTGTDAMFVTAALFNEVVSVRPDAFAGVRDLMVGGDALNVGRIRTVLDQEPGHRPDRVINGYGPTETTTFAVCHTIGELPAGARSVPLGRSIARAGAHVLDRHLHPVPDGVVGELHVSGPGVARGYAGRPGATADRFVPDPFAADGSRLYRTGDRARRNPDGTIEFLGRDDAQVKINGFRVEPGEVESVMAGHPDLAQSVVTAFGGRHERRLAAYVVVRPGRAVTGAELRAYLLERLPAYAVPAAFVELESIPTTGNGKVDRRALPDPGTARTVAVDDVEPVAPRSAVEATVTELMAALLGRARVGVNQDFFALGGHSLLAMRLVSRVNDACSCDVPLREFLEVPTAERLAAAVGRSRAAGATVAAPTAGRDERLLARLDDMSDDEVERLLREVEGEVRR